MISKLSKELLEFNQGIEKEGLRTDSNGVVSQKPHHQDLGHKLTHPYITTDYSENLLEFISPVFNKDKNLLNFIEQVHSYSFKKMDKDELIWPASMPAVLPEDDFDIPLAYYGESFSGKIKTLYRSGLGYRYGRSMQTIAGMHFNFSFSKNFILGLYKELGSHDNLQSFQDDLYFKLIRNFKRTNFILPFLFGASPVVDKSFLKEKKHNLKLLAKDTYGLKYATSLRMGGLGYTSDAQESISICYNQLHTYIQFLEEARLTSYPSYEKIGLKKDGEYIQLNTNLLQIDNEFYSTLRPKHVALSGESALQALNRAGVEYIEIRLMDLNPYELGGINEEAVRFLQHYLTYCLCAPSETILPDECSLSDQNFKEAVTNGRDPNSTINFRGDKTLLKDATMEILSEMEDLLGCCDNLKSYFSPGIDRQKVKCNDYSLLPSQKIMDNINDETSFVEHIKTSAKKLKEKALNLSEDQDIFAELNVLRTKSFKDEEKITRNQSGDFESYLHNYFQQIKIEQNNA